MVLQISAKLNERGTNRSSKIGLAPEILLRLGRRPLYKTVVTIVAVHARIQVTTVSPAVVVTSDRSQQSLAPEELTLAPGVRRADVYLFAQRRRGSQAG